MPEGGGPVSSNCRRAAHVRTCANLRFWLRFPSPSMCWLYHFLLAESLSYSLHSRPPAGFVFSSSHKYAAQLSCYLEIIVHTAWKQWPVIWQPLRQDRKLAGGRVAPSAVTEPVREEGIGERQRPRFDGCRRRKILDAFLLITIRGRGACGVCVWAGTCSCGICIPSDNKRQTFLSNGILVPDTIDLTVFDLSLCLRNG